MGFIQRKGLVIGIDPDIDKSGIAVINLATRTLEVDTLPFPELLAPLGRARGEVHARRRGGMDEQGELARHREP